MGDAAEQPTGGAGVSIRTTLLAAITLLNVFIAVQAGGGLWRSWSNYGDARRMEEASLVTNTLYSAERRLSQERAAAISALYTPQDAAGPLAERMAESQRGADSILAGYIPAFRRDPALGRAVERVEEGYRALLVLRREIDAALALPVERRDPRLADSFFDAATALINDIRDLIEEVSRPVLAHDAVVALQMRFKHFVWQVTEDTGKEYAMIARLIAENKAPSDSTLQTLFALQGRVDVGWDNIRALARSSRLAEAVGPSLEEAETHYFMTFDQIKGIFYLPGQQAAGPDSYPISAEIWLELATQAADSLFALKEVALRETQGYADRMAAQAERAIIVNICLFACALLLGAYSFYIIIWRVARPVNAMADALYRAARGEPYAPLKARASADEIGKLAHVLDAFRRTAEERERYLQDLERSNRELDDFAYIASHDLKEPLRGLHNFSRFLLEDYGDKLEGEGRSMLETIASLTQRMENLLNVLLHYSRLGRTDLSVRETDLNEVVESIRAMLSITLKEKNARIFVPERLPAVVCDHIKVAEVFQNLIGNAIKYNDSEEKVIEVGFTRNHPRAPGRTVFYVRDNGIGIEERNLESVFRIFHRLHAREAYGGGTGSGLTIAKKIVGQHHGEIWAESQGPGTGTAFFFTLQAE